MQNQPAGTSVTISGAISGVGNFTKSGAGTLVLSGANTYSGISSNINGILSVGASINKVTGGSASSSLGHPTTVANGTIHIGATTTAATLIYTGAGETTDRVIDLSALLAALRSSKTALRARWFSAVRSRRSARGPKR